MQGTLFPGVVAGHLEGLKRGRAWSEADQQKLREAVMQAHACNVFGQAKVAEFVQSNNLMPGRSLYATYWQLRKDRTGWV